MHDIAYHQKIGRKTHVFDDPQFMLKAFDGRLAQVIAVAALRSEVGLFPQGRRRIPATPAAPWRHDDAEIRPGIGAVGGKCIGRCKRFRPDGKSVLILGRTFQNMNIPGGFLLHGPAHRAAGTDRLEQTI